MNIFDILAIIICLTAYFSFINHLFLKLPTTIGVMLVGLFISLALIFLQVLGFQFSGAIGTLMRRIDFNQTLMQGMLSYLLFAGALHVNLEDLARQKWIISLLATIGVTLSTFISGTLFWYLTTLFDINLPYIYCLLFGALISPTDPIAVLAILKTAGVSKSLETKITGESLFNDGVGVVIFILIAGVALGGHDVTPGAVAVLFSKEALGGALLGLCSGYITYLMLKRVNNYQVEILLTLALVTGGYALAAYLHVSGPIAVVVAGLLIGNHGRLFAMDKTTREHLDTFWELIDEILNAVLFVMIGLEVLIISFTGKTLMLGVICIIIVLGARFISVGLPIALMRISREFSPHAVKILTWGGLRGGISVALALSLPPGPEKELILTVTYCIVVFSILVQGLSIGRLIQWSKEGASHGPKLG